MGHLRHVGCCDANVDDQAAVRRAYDRDRRGEVVQTVDGNTVGTEGDGHGSERWPVEQGQVGLDPLVDVLIVFGAVTAVFADKPRDSHDKFQRMR
jgi:hypothetical protein